LRKAIDQHPQAPSRRRLPPLLAQPIEVEGVSVKGLGADQRMI
jgi:hypothetical protein